MRSRYAENDSRHIRERGNFYQSVPEKYENVGNIHDFFPNVFATRQRPPRIVLARVRS